MRATTSHDKYTLVNGTEWGSIVSSSRRRGGRVLRVLVGVVGVSIVLAGVVGVLLVSTILR